MSSAAANEALTIVNAAKVKPIHAVRIRTSNERDICLRLRETRTFDAPGE
jgi:hypothetical protein